MIANMNKTLVAALVAAAGLHAALVPATDDPLRTHLVTPAGTFPFQEWFVARGHRDEVDGLRFEGAETARPAPGTLEALAEGVLAGAGVTLPIFLWSVPLNLAHPTWEPDPDFVFNNDLFALKRVAFLFQILKR